MTAGLSKIGVMLLLGLPLLVLSVAVTVGLVVVIVKLCTQKRPD